MNLKNLNLTLFLIRHAQPQNPPNHWTSPSSPLSDQGILQAKVLAENLKELDFDILISSPFARAFETAKYILNAAQNKASLNQQEWLSEIDLGFWGGKNKVDITMEPNFPKFFPKDKAVRQEPLVARLLNTHKEFTFPEGESLAIFWKRVQKGFIELLDNYRNLDHHTLGFIGHTGTFSVMISILLGKNFLDNNFPVMAIKMADYLQVRIYKERIVFVKLN